MAAGLRSTASASGTGTTITLPVPAGASANDTLCAVVYHGPNIHFPNGVGLWTTIAQEFGNTSLRVFQLKGSPLGGPWAFTTDISTPWVAVVLALTGAVGETVALDTYASVITTATTSVTAPAVTPTTDNDLVISTVGWAHATTFTGPAGVTEQADRRTGDTVNDLALYVGTSTLTGGSGSSVGSAVVGNDNPFTFASGQFIALTLAVRSTPPPAAWTGDFETGDLSQYTLVQTAASDRIQILTDTPFQGTKYARFTCLNTDVYPLTPTVNPRAQLVKDGLLYPGTTRWISWACRWLPDFPATLPITPQVNSFFVFAQIHGFPFNGSPAVAFDVDHPERITFRRNGQYNFDTMWTTPLVRGPWHEFAMHIRFAQDETGWVELWYNRHRQTFKDGSKRLYMQTVQSDQNTGVQWIPTLYRCLGMYDTASMDHDAHRVDTVEPDTIAYVRRDEPLTRRLDGNGVGFGRLTA